MKRVALAVAVLACCAQSAVQGQRVQVRFDVVAMTYQEISSGFGQSKGAGAGLGVAFRVRRFGVDMRAHSARVDTPGPGRANFTFRQFDSRFGYYLTEFLALELGGGRRTVEPDFAAPEVGFVRAGVLSENQLHSQAKVWVRGAYIADPRFDTGGSASTAFEFSLGVAFGSATGRFRVHAEYEFQRMDRTVSGSDVPLQLSLARTGIAFGF